MIGKSGLARLASEARKLAMQCVNGTAPEFGRLSMGRAKMPPCALGRLSIRFDGRRTRTRYPSEMVGPGAAEIRIWAIERLVYQANDEALPEDRNGAVVFPLLALADALEETP